MSSNWEEEQKRITQPPEQMSLFDPDPVSWVSAPRGAREPIYRVRVEDFAPRAEKAFANLLQSMNRLQSLGSDVAPEVAERQIRRTKALQDETTKSTRETKNELRDITDLTSVQANSQDAINEKLKLGHETLLGMARTHQMIASEGDTEKTIRYRYIADDKQLQEATVPVDQARESLRAHVAGTATKDQRVEAERIITDLTAKQNRLVDERNRAISRTVQQTEQERRAQVRVNETFARGNRFLIDRLQKEGLLAGKRGDRYTLIAQETSTGAVVQTRLGEQEIAQLSAKRRRGEQLTDDERQKLTGLETALRTRLAARNVKEGDPHFRLSEVIGNLARGNIGGALGEATQSLPGTDRARARIENFGGSIVDRSAARGGIGGLLGRGAGGLIGALGASLFTPAAALVAQQAFTRGLAQRREVVQLGQVTGEGAGAGISARFRSFVQGINPFDIVSGRQAMEFQMAARQQGFRGRQADQVSNVLGDVVNKLGTDWKAALEGATVATREGGSTLGEFRQTLLDLRQTARDTGTSVQSLQEGLLEFSKAAIAQGATQQQATGRFSAAQQGLAGTVLSLPQGSARLQAWLSQSAGAIAMMAGIPIWEAMSMSVSQWAREIDKLIGNIIKQKPPGMRMETWAQQLVFMQLPLFSGLDVPGVLALLRSHAKGGFEAGLNRSEEERASSRASAAGATHHRNRFDIAGRAIGAISHGISERLRHDPVAHFFGFGGGDDKPHYDITDPQKARDYNRRYQRQMREGGISEEHIRHYVQVDVKIPPQFRKYLEVTNQQYQRRIRGGGSQGTATP